MPRRISGWVKALRKMKDNIFVDVDDGSSIQKLQVVIPKSLATDTLGYGCSLEVTGRVVINPSKKLEIAAETIKVLGPCYISDQVYPFLPRKTYAPDYVRQYLHLRNRTNTFGSILRVRSAAAHAFRNELHHENFIEVNTPILTSNDCEGAGEVFIVKPGSENLVKTMIKENMQPDEAYFDSKAYLTVSGQLHLEAAVRGLGKVYTFGPAFRAENSQSRHHLSEFYMLEAEVAFIENFNELLLMIENLIKNVTGRILGECEKDIEFLLKQNDETTNVTLVDLCQKPFAVLTYDEAVKILQEHSENFKTFVRPGENLAKEHELFLVKHNGGYPVFVVGWPHHMKPFYMKQMDDDKNKVYAVDLLFPVVGEVCGGSMREDNFVLLEERLQKINQDKSLSWYLDLRKYGNVPTGGFGLGFERYLQSILGISSIKEAIPFPRWPHNCML